MWPTVYSLCMHVTYVRESMLHDAESNDLLYTTAVCCQSEDVYFSDCLYTKWLPDLGYLVSKVACLLGLSLSSFMRISACPCLCVCLSVLWVIGFDLLVCKPPVRYMVIDSNHSWHTCVPACLSVWVCVLRMKYSISPELTFSSYFIVCFASLVTIVSGFVIFVRIFLPAAAYSSFFFCSQPRGGLLLPSPSHALCFDCLHKMKSYLYCGYSKQQIIVSNVLRAAQRQKNISPMTLHYDPCWLRKYKSQYLQVSYDDWNFLQGKSECLNVHMMTIDKSNETNALLCCYWTIAMILKFWPIQISHYFQVMDDIMNLYCFVKRREGKTF